MSNPLLSLLTIVRARFDGWANIMTGVGNNRGRTGFEFEPDWRLADPLLAQLYAGDPFASRICHAVPKEALRKGVRVRLGDTGVETSVANDLRRLQAVRKYIETWTWARAFGGACLWIGVDDGLDPAEPLDVSRVRGVLFLEVLTKRELTPFEYYRNTSLPNYGETSVYRLQRAGGPAGGADMRLIHASRMIRFDGAMTDRFQRQENQGWCQSELQRVLYALRRFNGAWASVDELMQDASQGVLKIKNLAAMMAADKQDLVKDRFELMDLMRSTARAMLIDADGEDFTRVQTNFTGVPDTLDKFMLYLAGSAEIPVTILMGQSPAGMNATGESDMRWFYDRLESEQQMEAGPRFEKLVRLMLLAKDGPTNGRVPDTLTISFPPLWQQTPKEQADTRLVIAQADQIYANIQAVTPEEIGTSRWRPEGYSPEMTVDLGARRAAMEADQAAAGTTRAIVTTQEPAKLPAPAAPADGPRGLPSPASHTDSADAPSGLAVVLQLPLDAALALTTQLVFAGREAPEDLHVTLAYLGQVESLDASALAAIEAIVRAWATTTPALDAMLGGIGRFAGLGDAPDPVYVPVDAPGLDDARAELVAMLEAAGVPPSSTHGFTPHLTIAYVAPDQALPVPRVAPQLVRFASAGIWAGPVRLEVPLGAAA